MDAQRTVPSRNRSTCRGPTAGLPVWTSGASRLRCAPATRDEGLAFEVAAGNRTLANPTLVTTAGTAMRVALANALAGADGRALARAHDGHAQRRQWGSAGRARRTVSTTRSRCATAPVCIGTTRIRTARRRARSIAVCSASSRSTTTTSASCGRRSISRPAAPSSRWCCRIAASATAIATRPPRKTNCWAGTDASPTSTAACVRITRSPHRRYRLRMLNASNARTYRLAFRRDDATALPFVLIGTDGGLLERGVRCEQVLLSPAERVDLLVDFADVAKGGFVVLESRAFDPMHAVPPTSVVRDGRSHDRTWASRGGSSADERDRRQRLRSHAVPDSRGGERIARR